MSKLTLVFPIAAVFFILLVFSEYIPCLKRSLGPVKALDKRFGRPDALAAGLLTAAYAVAAFVNLGSMSAPQSFCRFTERGQYALLELEEETEVSAVMYYTGLHTGDYYLQFSADGETWVDQVSMPQHYADLFKWKYAELQEDNGPVRYVRIIAGGELNLGELALFNGSGEQIPAESLSYDSGCAKLFDEQDTAPEKPDFSNSSYFDEIYHARTALEHIQGEEPYEISHPPLGKILIGMGIRLFGMTPFGWRFTGTLFGVLMVPLMYVFLKKLFGGLAVPVCLTAVFAFDFMHFVQTRIATIDTYAVFFILLMYLFMYLYLTAERGGKAPRKRWLLPLALSGLSFGLGAASKWTCLYAGAGLGLIWLIDRVWRYLTARKEEKTGEYWRETGENVFWCLLFFVAAPCCVYYVSYYPYGVAEGMSGAGMFFTREYLDIVIGNQKYMFSYHVGVDATHPYSSQWWQWILNIRPILYYLEYFDGGTKSTIGAFVNPMLCWGGLAAMVCMAYLALFRRDKTAGFILLGYLAQVLPWVPVERITFEYHYFPATVFLTLALGHVFNTVWQRSPSRRRILLSFTIVSLVLFAAYYPVLSGAEVSTWYANSFLRWLPSSWPF